MEKVHDLLHYVRHRQLDDLVLNSLVRDLHLLLVHARHYVFLNLIARINKSILNARWTVPILNLKFEKEDSAKQNFQLRQRHAIATDIFLKRTALADKLTLASTQHKQNLRLQDT